MSGLRTASTNKATGFNQFDGLDIATNFDWLSQQNGGQFDPQLFGDYREPQENILANANFDDGFFNEALDADFFTPFNMHPIPDLQKKSLVAEIDAQQNADDETLPKSEAMNCNKIWDTLQNCPKVQNGDFDLDGLCSELTKKAKCSGKGPVVKEREFNDILKKYLGGDLSDVCGAPTQ